MAGRKGKGVGFALKLRLRLAPRPQRLHVRAAGALLFIEALLTVNMVYSYGRGLPKLSACGALVVRCFVVATTTNAAPVQAAPSSIPAGRRSRKDRFSAATQDSTLTSSEKNDAVQPAAAR
jgi:hypothetical protein